MIIENLLLLYSTHIDQNNQILVQNADKVGPAHHWYKTWWGALILLMLTGFSALFVASLFFVINQVKLYKSDPLLYGLKKSGAYQSTSGRDNYWLGANQPKLTIVEFADYACPYSKKSFPTMRELMTKYKSDIKFVFRELPITSEASIDLALAARCAGEQGLYWPMHDKLFENQEVTSQDGLVGLAEQIGADKTRFGDCLLQKKYLPKLQENYTDAESFGISGTPTWFINGYKVAGDLPAETWEQIIDIFERKK